jgi:hypothetical protein
MEFKFFEFPTQRGRRNAKFGQRNALMGNAPPAQSSHGPLAVVRRRSIRAVNTTVSNSRRKRQVKDAAELLTGI